MQDFEWIFKKENIQQKVNFELSHQIYLPTLFSSFESNKRIFLWGLNIFVNKTTLYSVRGFCTICRKLRFQHGLLIWYNIPRDTNILILTFVFKNNIHPDFLLQVTKLCHNLGLICKSGLEHNPIS